MYTKMILQLCRREKKIIFYQHTEIGCIKSEKENAHVNWLHALSYNILTFSVQCIRFRFDREIKTRKVVYDVSYDAILLLLAHVMSC